MNEILRQLLEKETSDVNDGRLDPTELKYKRRTKRTVGGQTFDIATPSEKSSRTMKNIPSSGTSIEDRLAAAMTDAGIFFCNPNQLIEPLEGKPDFVLPRFKIAVFCDGDFWHTKESGSKKVKNNSDFWNAKIDRNIARDVEVREILEGLGWKVLRFLGSDIQKNIEDCIRRLNHEISRRQDTKEPRFTFIDLFAGIGGFRVALEKLGGKCLGFAEIDKAATEVYKLNFLGLESTEEAEFGSGAPLDPHCQRAHDRRARAADPGDHRDALGQPDPERLAQRELADAGRRAGLGDLLDCQDRDTARDQRPGDHRAGTDPALDESLLHQLREGGLDGVAGDPEVSGEHPRRGQAVARCERPREDVLPELAIEPHVERNRFLPRCGQKADPRRQFTSRTSVPCSAGRARPAAARSSRGWRWRPSAFRRSR